jgi:hypothetical protein
MELLRSSELRKKGRPRKYWAFDSEFMMSGRAGHPEDVHTVQFSDGEDSWILNSAAELKEWLHTHKDISKLYGFNILCDLASIHEWLGGEYVITTKKGVQHQGWIKYGGAKIHAFDAMPLLSSFGLRRLSDCGDQIGYLKLAKPDWLGQRKYENQEEYQQFASYAKADAIITSRIVRWLIENYGADPAIYVSAGTIAAHEFDFPRRLKKFKSGVAISPFEKQVKLFTYAGRSEGFITGFSQNALYNDVASLYPISIVATRALQIKGAKPCDLKELAVTTDLTETRYGWIEGDFRTMNDMWGLPVRGKRNYYMTGDISGLYNSFDIVASKAEIIHVKRCFKPIFREEN